jgi:hypothetical protein
MEVKEMLEIEPLSKALQCTLRLAQEQGAGELAKWLRLEISGYNPSNSHSVIIVPDYRAVAGAHLNIFGQRVKVQPGSSSTDKTYLREGVEALESLRNSRQTIVLQDPTTAGLIGEPGEAATFHFEPRELDQVLSRIRSELSNRARVLAHSNH